MIKIRTESFSELFGQIDKIKNHDERVKALASYSGAIVDFLKWTFDPSIQIKIDTKKLSFRPVPYTDGLEGALYRTVRNIYIFLGDMTPKKIQLFERMLESVSYSDAELLIGMVNKKLPYKHIDFRLVSEAFPDMFPQNLETAQALTDIQDLGQELDNAPEIKPKKSGGHGVSATENICPLCEKNMGTWGMLVMHYKRSHKFTPEQLDQARAERKAKKNG